MLITLSFNKKNEKVGNWNPYLNCTLKTFVHIRKCFVIFRILTCYTIFKILSAILFLQCRLKISNNYFFSAQSFLICLILVIINIKKLYREGKFINCLPNKNFNLFGIYRNKRIFDSLLIFTVIKQSLLFMKVFT